MAQSALKGSEQPIARYLTKVIDALQGEKSQRDIAAEMGYEKPNVISMFKKGEMKVPLDKIPALAKAIGADPAFLFRMAIEQYWPDLKKTIAEVFGDVVTRDEARILKLARTAAPRGEPVELSDELEAELKEVFHRHLHKTRTRRAS